MVVLGILGARNAITKQIMQDEILNPILDDLGKDQIKKILLPSEPLSSTYIECWAQRQGIETMLLKSDWVNNGRRAGVVRDAQIQKECNAFLIFEGPKSRYYLDLAERIAKKNADVRVYVVESKSVSPVLLQADQESRFTINEASEKELLTNPKAGVNVNTLDKMWSTANKPTKCLIEDD
jgi:hypothetical protein